MKSLEDQLRETMRREEPPAGFAERLLARAEPERAVREAAAKAADARRQGSNVVPFPGRAVWRDRRVAAVAASLVAALGLAWGAESLRRGAAQDGRVGPVEAQDSGASERVTPSEEHGQSDRIDKPPAVAKTPRLPVVAQGVLGFPDDRQETRHVTHVKYVRPTRTKAPDAAEPTPEELRAEQQVLLALQITKEKLSVADRHILQIRTAPGEDVAR